MKTIKFTFPVLLTSILLLAGCQRDSSDELAVSKINEISQSVSTEKEAIIDAGNSPTTEAAGTCNPNAYLVILESNIQVGNNWEWIWSVQNSNPGNGNNGTAQDLSHWGMELGTCVNFAHITDAAYSNDGIVWTSFTPSYQIETSQSCKTVPVLKFDYGTTGNAKTYYRLTVNTNYTPGTSLGYYKSGNRTGCCTFSFTGLGCGEEEGPR